MELGPDPEPIPETFRVSADNLEEARDWVHRTAAHYEDQHTVVGVGTDGLEVAGQLARPGDTLTYGEKTGVLVAVPLHDAVRSWQQSARDLQAVVGTPAEAAAFEAHQGTSGQLATAWIREMPAPSDSWEEDHLAGLPRDHPRTPGEAAALEAAKAQHPSATSATATRGAGVGVGLTEAMPPAALDGVTMARAGARLN